ncbi:MAG TPA: hypothetical protein VHZ96_06990 [Frankiaceae bacterium]|jgi:hypothetical protein|nr:hypothetical protein [Frankiaceae bacterium]
MPPTLPLDTGEFTEVVLRGALRDPAGTGRVVAFLERFLGMRFGGRRWVVLTNRRLLVLRRRNPKSYAADRWFDVSLDRRRIQASMPFMEGSLVVMAMVSSKGPSALLLPSGAFKEAQRMARALGADGR